MAKAIGRTYPRPVPVPLRRSHTAAWIRTRPACQSMRAALQARSDRWCESTPLVRGPSSHVCAPSSLRTGPSRRKDFKGCGHVSSVTHKGSCDPDSHLYLNGKKVNTSRMKASLRAGRVGLGRMQPLTDQFVWNLAKGLVFFRMGVQSAVTLTRT